MAIHIRAQIPGAPPNTAPIAHARLYRECLAGDLPADALPAPADREHLVYELWSAGWTDAEIATHTRMSTYTTSRIRARLGLAAHPVITNGAVA